MAIAAQTAAAPDELLLAAARQRPGPLRRAGRGRLRRRQRALRPGRGDRHVPPHGRRDAGRHRAGGGHAAARWWSSTPSTPAPSTASGASRTTARRCRCHPTSSQHAEITTRDIDRGDFPHFLLKEISEAPASFRKTLRGKIVERDGQLDVALGPDTLPDDLRARLRDGSIRRVVVIGQGTAAIAGQSLAAVLGALTNDQLRAEAVLATELSGFQLRDDMSDTLVVAISQSGTTTDTNRTVDLARARGAGGRRRSSTGATATSSTSPTACSTRPTGATSRWRCRPPRRSTRRSRPGPCSPSPSPTRSRRCDGARVHELLDALRSLPDAMRPRARAARRHRRDRPPARPHAPLLGGRRQRPQPHRRRRGADQAVRALLQVDRPATPPRTRSTSTCRPSR